MTDKKTEAYKFTNVQSGDWHYSFDEDDGGCYDALFWHRETVVLVEQPAKPHEPVAWLYNGKLHEIDPSDWATGTVTPLFQLAQRNPLTDADIERIYGDHHDKFGQPVDSKANGWAYERAIISAALGVKEKA